MKNHRGSILFLTPVILLVEATNVSAQVHTSVGVRVGVNTANASYTSTMSGVSKSARTGLVLGSIVEIGFSDIVFLRAEPMYTQNGAMIDIADRNESVKETYKLEYLEIPVHVKAQFGVGALRPYIFAGPNLGILLSAKIDEEIPLAFAGAEYRQSGTRDIKDQTSSTNFGFDFGAGVAYDVTANVSLLVDARYSVGLTNIAKSPDPNDQSFHPESWKSRDIKVLAGVLFVL